MSTPFRKRRREDLTQYIETDQVQSNLTYDKIGSTIKEASKSLMGFFHTDDGKALPYHMRADCFYTRTEPYKKRATRPLPPGTLDTLKRIRKGFDPLEMTLSRWKKQDQQAKEEQQAEEAEKEALIQRSIARRRLQKEEQPKPAKKIIKTYHIDAEDSNNDLKWELLDKKIELALDSLQQNNKDDKYERKGFFEGENNKRSSQKTGTVNTDLQKADSQSQPTQSQERHHEIQAATQNPNPEVLPEKKAQPQVAENSVSETKVEPQKPSPVVNPFKNGPSKQPLTLMDMINKHKQPPFISNAESQSQTTVSKQLGQSQTTNPFQVSMQAYASIQSQQYNQPSPSFTPNFATTSTQQVTNNYITNQSNNPFADKGPKPQEGQFFHNSESNITLHQGNHVQSTPSFQNYQKNSMNPQQLTMNPLPNTFSPLNATQLKGMFESSHQTHKDSLGLFDKASSAASDKTKKKGPTYRHRKDNQIRVS